MKKFVLALLAVVLVLGLCTVAMAEGTESARPENTEAPACTYGEHSDYQWAEVAEATCTEPAKLQKWCPVCDVYFGELKDSGEANGHEKIGPYTEEATTCGQRGMIYYNCSVCKATKIDYEYTDVIEHNWVKDTANSVAATCLKDGVYAEKCTICGAKRSEVIYANLQHIYDIVVVDVPATCYEDGYKTTKCACGEIKTVYTAAYNHKWDNGRSALGEEVFVTEPKSCYADGEGYQVCERLGCHVECVIPASHNFTDWHVDEAATCEKDGFMSRDCRDCTDKVSGKPYQEVKVLPALGHKVNFELKKAATCVEEGLKQGGCQRCYEVVSEILPKVDHTWTEWTVTGACKVRTCKVCNLIDVCTDCVVDPETPADPDAPAGDDDDNDSEGTGSSTGSGSDASIPATGDNTSNVPYIMMVAAVAGLVVLVASKRKVNC